jgi:hypothetical protein
MEIALHKAYGQIASDLTRIPTLIPEIYALARCGHVPLKIRERANSIIMATAIASAVFG